ncbi:porin family protein [Roseobacter sinensis]|uniref:Porin family protein n=1 Tax=Roseobacter sinensis TaxID=2931391 RepID=A0ABT3BAG5_9RHOB|nr:porin family protein [Roseobacter sp. WL0113]MCV3270568.1 porin family protein [Roseobacter sp. WL0113]
MKRMQFLGAIALATALPFAVQAEGFYLGIQAATFDVSTGTVDGDGNGIGVLAGYRFQLTSDYYAEAEIGYSKLNGDTETGLSEYDSQTFLDFGVGRYLTDTTSLSVHLGYTEIDFENSGSDLSSDGAIIGVQLGYDFSPVDTIAIRASYSDTNESTFDQDSDGRVLSVRYVRRF